MSGHETMLPRGARILQVMQESARVRRLVMDARLDAVPGQFVMAWLPGVNERPFSLAAADPLTLLVAQVGPFTAALRRLQAGDWLWWRGPFGHGFTLPELPAYGPVTLRPSLLLVAGGYGVAPLAFLAHRARATGWPVSVAMGARTREDILLPGEFATLGCQVQLCTEDGSAGLKGLVTEAVEQVIPVAPRAAADSIGMLYGCGPQGMLEALRALCGAHRVPCQLCYEAVMKCAQGVCGSCARAGFLVCKDGPVFAWSGEGNPTLADPPTQPIRSG
jgi:dihydroorotate dehydrogenase electron transfer subunit